MNVQTFDSAAARQARAWWRTKRLMGAGEPGPRRARPLVPGSADEASDATSVAGEEDPGAALDPPPPVVEGCAGAVRTGGPVGSAEPGLSPETVAQDPLHRPDPPGASASVPARAGANRSGRRRPR